MSSLSFADLSIIELLPIMFSFKAGETNSSNDDFLSEFSMEPIISSTRTSVTQSMFESNYVSEPFYISTGETTLYCPPIKVPRISEASMEEFNDQSISSLGMQTSDLYMRPGSVVDVPNCDKVWSIPFQLKSTCMLYRTNQKVKIMRPQFCC